MIRDQRMAVVGAGKMGEALLRGLLEASALDPERVRVTTGSGDRARQLADQLGVRAAESNAAAVREADVVILAVKPQHLPVSMAARSAFQQFPDAFDRDCLCGARTRRDRRCLEQRVVHRLLRRFENGFEQR